MKVAIEREQKRVDARREHDEQQRQRKDTLDIVQAHRLHEEVAQAALRAEHLAEQRADERERKPDADAGDDLGQRRGTRILRVSDKGERPSTRAVLKCVGLMLRTAFMAKMEIGTMPWIAPNATLAGMPMPKMSRITG